MTALGFTDESLKYLVHQMVTFIEGGEKMKMSKRAGAFVTLKELMEKVGVDSTRYFFVMRKADSHLVFDIDLAKKQDAENPVYYIQYVYARISSIIAFAESQGFEANTQALREGFDPEKITHDDEWALVKLITEFPSVLRNSAVHLEPHRLTGYLEEVAAAFHHWYQKGIKTHELRVVTEDLSMSKTRLFLAFCTKNIIARGLELLGVSRPERM
jgi:arginyl-tRNA synthetase